MRECSLLTRLNTVARLAVWSDDVVVEEADVLVLAVEAARAYMGREGEPETQPGCLACFTRRRGSAGRASR